MHSQLPPVQLTVQVAPWSQVVLQLPPVQLTEHVEPAAQVVLQSPPRQETKQDALALHSVVHPPLKQLSEHSLLAAQVVVHAPVVSPHARSHFPAAGHSHVLPVHEPAPPDDDEESTPPSPVLVAVPSVKSYVHAGASAAPPRAVRNAARKGSRVEAAAGVARIEPQHRARRSPIAQTRMERGFTVAGASAAVGFGARRPPSASRVTLADGVFAMLAPARFAQPRPDDPGLSSPSYPRT